MVSLRQRRRRGGFTLVVLIITLTVMGILAATALPLWSQKMRRDREEELIFRGFQYAEAIRIFQRRFGRYPVRLEELMETKPRCIRQLWKDPWSGDGSWDLIILATGRPGQPGPPVPGVGIPGMIQQQPEVPPQMGPDGQPLAQSGPILGVASKSEAESLKTLFNRHHYNEWRFTADLVRAPIRLGPGASVSHNQSARWLGRPFPQFMGGLAPNPGFPPGAGGMPPGVGVPGMPPGGKPPGG